MYTGPKPTGQPRTLRSIAESHISGGEKLLPDPEQPAGTYKDPAADLTSPQKGPSPSVQKSPFK